MIVWAQGKNLSSTPSRYHYVPQCWINTHWTAKAPIYHPVFQTTEAEAKWGGWWPCPYCDPPAS